MITQTATPSNRDSKQLLTVKDMSLTAMFAVLMAVCSWISIPTAVPFTLQTFAVFCAVSMLGGKRGFFAVLVYILLGAVGIPVFSGGYTSRRYGRIYTGISGTAFGVSADREADIRKRYRSGHFNDSWSGALLRFRNGLVHKGIHRYKR